MRTRFTRNLILGVLGTAMVVGAYFRGDYLLGEDVGFLFAGMTFALLAMMAWTNYRGKRVGFGLLLIAVCAIMISPTTFSPDLRHFIDDRATDRQARKELYAVLRSDPAYRDLSVSTVFLKSINITIEGTVDSRDDVPRLRERIRRERPGFQNVNLRWAVQLRGENGSWYGDD